MPLLKVGRWQAAVRGASQVGDHTPSQVLIQTRGGNDDTTVYNSDIKSHMIKEKKTISNNGGSRGIDPQRSVLRWVQPPWRTDGKEWTEGLTLAAGGGGGRVGDDNHAALPPKLVGRSSRFFLSMLTIGIWPFFPLAPCWPAS